MMIFLLVYLKPAPAPLVGATFGCLLAFGIACLACAF